MPLSPSSVTSEEHTDDLGRNPWAGFNNNVHIVMDGDTSEQSKDDVQKFNGRPSHIRSHTTAGHPLRAPSPPNDSEPYDDFIRGTSLDLHDTRPSLKRIINGNVPEETSNIQRGGTNTKGTRAQEAGADVIVHQIRSTDSLAGVALKYNISVAALRNANKLWASDSIHLRQVLYIPIQTLAAQRCTSVSASEGACSGVLPLILQPASDFRTTSSSLQRKRASEWDTATQDSETSITHASTAHTIAAGASSTIKRVPLSELSFFPPSSTSTASHSSRFNSRSVRPKAPPSLGPNSSRSIPRSATLPHGSLTPQFFFGTSGGSVSGTPLGLTGFFNGAKDEIISRLSLDSVRGSSDTTEDPEVEMDIVRPKTLPNLHNVSLGRDIISRQDGMAPLAESAWERDSTVLMTPPKSQLNTVRTVQLQPSPKMQIPVVSRVDKSSSRTKHPEPEHLIDSS